MVVARTIFSTTSSRSSARLWRWKSHNNNIISMNHPNHHPCYGLSVVRPFFASSTDHTRLLQNAQIHRLHDSNNDVVNYILAPDGMDLEMVQKVRQLHLARIVRQGHLIYGATVVNSTLGKAPEVCRRLLDAALEDAWGDANNKDEQKGSVVVQAKSTLHGLSDWVQKGIINNNNIGKEGGGEDSVFAPLFKSSTNEKEASELLLLEAIQDIIRNGSQNTTLYETGKQDWERLAQEFVKKGMGEEAALYQSKGGELYEILHGVDTSSYANTSGGTMALFNFSVS